MKSRIVCSLIVSAIALSLIAPQAAEARGRGAPSPFVMTPDGLIPKSVFYQDMILMPGTLEAYRRQEQQYYDRMNKNKNNTDATRTTGVRNTAVKPTITKKKK
ncbi:MAG: hypothetical protein K8U03_10335 [Planctomycetia bacterium]|nr:hypothetical protein [Planctomycetia bacterium]